jgi:serine/threonine-protein phosphatase 2B catalytic subunit
MGIARMNLVLKKMRENRDEINKVKMLTPNHKAPVGMILGGKEVINSALMQFHKNLESDVENEAFPVRSRRLSTKTM